MMSVNLLPWRETKKQQHIFHVVLYASVSACLIFFISFFVKNFLGYKTLILEKENTALNASIEAIAPNHLTQNTQFLTKLQLIDMDKAKTTNENKKTEGILFEIANALPNSMLFQSMTMLNNAITINGNGNSINDIHNYVTLLQQKIRKSTVTLSNIHSDTQLVSQFDFTIRVNL